MSPLPCILPLLSLGQHGVGVGETFLTTSNWY